MPKLSTAWPPSASRVRRHAYLDLASEHTMPISFAWSRLEMSPRPLFATLFSLAPVHQQQFFLPIRRLFVKDAKKFRLGLKIAERMANIPRLT